MIECTLCQWSFNEDQPEKIVTAILNTHHIWHAKAHVHHRNMTQGIAEWITLYWGLSRV